MNEHTPLRECLTEHTTSERENKQTVEIWRTTASNERCENVLSKHNTVLDDVLYI